MVFAVLSLIVWFHTTQVRFLVVQLEQVLQGAVNPSQPTTTKRQKKMKTEHKERKKMKSNTEDEETEDTEKEKEKENEKNIYHTHRSVTFKAVTGDCLVLGSP